MASVTLLFDSFTDDRVNGFLQSDAQSLLKIRAFYNGITNLLGCTITFLRTVPAGSESCRQRNGSLRFES